MKTIFFLTLILLFNWSIAQELQRPIIMEIDNLSSLIHNEVELEQKKIIDKLDLN